MMKYIKLGKICNIKTGKLDANASSENGIYPFFTCSREPLKISSYSYDCECVLVAGNGELNVKYYNGKFDAYQRTYIIEVLDKIKYSTKFLYLLINSKMEELRNASIGGVIKYIKLGNLTDIDVPIIAIDKQNDIVNNMLSMNKVIRLKKSQIKKFDVLIKSQFVEMFENKNYPRMTGKELFTFSSGKFLEESKRKNSGFPVYGGNGITWYTDQPLIDFDTIIFGRVGAYCGNVKKVNEPVWITDNAIYIKKFRTDAFNLNFLFNMLEFIDFSRFAQHSGQPKITQKPLEEYNYVIPPIEEQLKFSKIVEQIDKQKFKFEKSLKKLEELQASLMQEYFG